MLEFNLVYFALLVVFSSRRCGEGVVVVETYFMEGQGIRSHDGLTRYGHGRRGTLLDDQDTFLHTDIHRQPVGPA